jgi:outer membrane protein assembly factor BamE (lipoprotein component of BamABCDE complex)
MNRPIRLLAAIAISTTFLTSCATSPQERWSHMEVGMTKQQVIALLGEPVSTTSNGALVTMEYDLAQQQPEVAHRSQPSHTSCYVMIGRDERVRSFGNN